MCRHLGYLGPPVSLRDLLVTPPFGLERQSYAPRQQAHGFLNADGWGVGWYVPDADEPARYRTARPLWSDSAFAGVAPFVRAGLVVASVRSATPPAPVEESGVAPFRSGRLLFAHNGVVEGFDGPQGVALRRLLRPETEAALGGRSDSEVLFGLLLDVIAEGVDLAAGVRAVIDAVSPIGGRYNLLVTDGERIVATRCGDTLVTGRLGDGHVVASEPFDNAPNWEPVPERSMVTITRDGVVIEPLDGAEPGAGVAPEATSRPADAGAP